MTSETIVRHKRPTVLRTVFGFGTYGCPLLFVAGCALGASSFHAYSVLRTPYSVFTGTYLRSTHRNGVHQQLVYVAEIASRNPFFPPGCFWASPPQTRDTDHPPRVLCFQWDIKIEHARLPTHTLTHTHTPRRSATLQSLLGICVWRRFSSLLACVIITVLIQQAFFRRCGSSALTCKLELIDITDRVGYCTVIRRHRLLLYYVHVLIYHSPVSAATRT
jgi:hypothetical protein